jgi:hypothetical protein
MVILSFPLVQREGVRSIRIERDLVNVIEAWPALPPDFLAAILAIVEAALGR